MTLIKRAANPRLVFLSSLSIHHVLFVKLHYCEVMTTTPKISKPQSSDGSHSAPQNTSSANQQNTIPAPKKGLILGGGGSKGSYTAGVWKALKEAGEQFDIVAGTSIGALVGAMVTADDLDGCMAMLGGMNENAVATRPFDFPGQSVNQPLKADQTQEFITEFTKGGPDFNPLKTTYLKYFDFDKFKSSSIDFACMTYNFTQQADQAFFKKDMTKDNFMDELLTSASYFPAYNFTQINGDYYLDGSFAQIIPWKTGLQMGADSLTIVSLAEPGTKDDVPEDAGFRIIRPILKLAYSVDFDGQTMVKQAEQGYLEGLKYLNRAPGYLYTFKPEDHLLIDGINKLGTSLLKRKNVELTQELLNEIWKGLLGYVPVPLETRTMKNYSIMYIIEALGITAGVDFYRQYSLKEFLQQILDHLDSVKGPVDSDPSSCTIWDDMQHRGIQDVIIFFHSAMNCFGTSLPPQFDVMKKTWILPFYLALAWRIIEKSRWIWNLI